MIRAELRSLYSPDCDDLRTLTFPDPTHFSIFIQVFVGPAGQIGQETFDLTVCSPSYLAELAQEQDLVLGYAYLVALRYDYQAIEAALRALCRRATGHTWEQVARKLDRIGHWEFSQYDDPDPFP